MTSKAHSNYGVWGHAPSRTNFIDLKALRLLQIEAIFWTKIHYLQLFDELDQTTLIA